MVDGGPSARVWRTSSYSENGDVCVAVAFAAEGVLVRDSKGPQEEAFVLVAGDPWRGFLEGLRSHSFTSV